MGCFGLSYPSFTAPQVIVPQNNPPNQFHNPQVPQEPLFPNPASAGPRPPTCLPAPPLHPEPGSRSLPSG